MQASVDPTIADKSKAKKVKTATTEPARKSTGKSKDTSVPKTTSVSSSLTALAPPPSKTATSSSTVQNHDDDGADVFYDDYYDDVSPVEPTAAEVPSSAEMLRRIKELEVALEESRSELTTILRKADARFGREKKFRESVNVSQIHICFYCYIYIIIHSIIMNVVGETNQ
jgi:hypothetical protein